MKKRTKRGRGKRLFSMFVFISLLLSVVFVAVMIFVSPSKLPSGSFDRTKSDYVLMLLQCLLGLVALLLPNILEKKWKFEISSGMEILYVLFLYCAIYLGEVKNFYYLVPHWDTILHTFSGAMLGALGFSVVSFMNQNENLDFHLSPLFVAFFAFCFALTLGVFWEIYEFSFDGILGLNMQKFRLEDGTLLLGRMALQDTMKDLIVDGVGAFIMSLVGYISLKYKKGWIELLAIFHRKEKEVD